MQEDHVTACLAMGDACLAMGEAEQAIEHYRQAMQVAFDERPPHYEAVCLLRLGNAYKELGKREQAVEHYTAALRIARDTPFRRIEAEACRNLALLYERSDPARAVEFMWAYVRNSQGREGSFRGFSGTCLATAEARARKLQRMRRRRK